MTSLTIILKKSKNSNPRCWQFAHTRAISTCVWAFAHCITYKLWKLFISNLIYAILHKIVSDQWTARYNSVKTHKMSAMKDPKDKGRSIIAHSTFTVFCPFLACTVIKCRTGTCGFAVCINSHCTIIAHFFTDWISAR